jgi:hypothetical protein
MEASLGQHWGSTGAAEAGLLCAALTCHHITPIAGKLNVYVVFLLLPVTECLYQLPPGQAVCNGEVDSSILSGSTIHSIGKPRKPGQDLLR